MTITVKPPKGNGAPIPVETTLVKKVNADGVLTFDILENKYTYEVINAIGKDGLLVMSKVKMTRKNM